MSAPAGALPVFPHYRRSDCSPMSATCISPLPQQCLLPQERYLYFPTAAAVSAPAGAPSISPHCRSSVRSRRSAIYISPLPQQCLLPQERNPYFPTAAAVSAPAGAFSTFPHCRSSARPRRSSINISPLPQQCPLPQERYLYFPTAAAVSTLTSSLLSPHRHASTLQQKPLLPPRCRSIITNGVQHPISPKAMQFLGGLLVIIWLLSHDKHFWGAFGSGPNAELGPLSPGKGSTPGSGTTTELGALSSDSTPNTHTIYSVHY